ncbi:MAG TPA: LCP family protein [Candidatus Acidoferrales bacterium]|nr:LCP family protein [Candidatus Acidoferrales bacterium]
MGRRPQRRRRASLKTGRQRAARASLVVAGFAVSILTGVLLYFLPAIQVALRDTGQTNTSLGGNPQLRPVSASESLSSTSPFTLLLLGSDSDSKFKGDYLTQSMILTRVDPVTKHVTMLSIPRDLWVRLCTGGYGKIDQAFLHGGAQCAIQTVEKDLGVHVDYYAWIGLQGLVSVLNQVGGVNVIANNPVMDDYYPADLSGGNPFDYQRILVLPGAQHMDGTLALEYVRARHDDAYGDFARSQRQQQILIALRAKTKTLTIADIPNLATSLGSDFQTDMSISRVSGLLPIAGSVPLSSITQVVLLPPYTSTETIDHQSALRPDWTLIRPVVDKYFPAN